MTLGEQSAVVASPPPRTRIHLRGLDGLRALALGMVVGLHAELPRFSAGYIGVDVFFVLSGYLITGILVGEASRRGRVDLRKYYRRRLLRIVPALTVLLLVLFVFGAAVLPLFNARTFPLAALASMTYLGDFLSAIDPTYMGSVSHLWSLSLEMQFYLLWPVVLTVCLRRWSREQVALVTFAVAIVMLLVMAMFYPSTVNHAPPAIYYLPISHGGSWLLGAALGLRPIRMPLGTGAAVVALVVLAVVVFTGPAPYHRSAGLMTFVAAMASALLIAAVTSPSGQLAARGLDVWPLTQVGLMSYSIYLWHLPIFWGISGHAFGSQTVTYLGKGFATLAVGTLSYVVVERPFLRRRG